MELTGRVIVVLPMREGTNAKGTWRSQDYVLETINEQYPRKMCFNAFGDKIDQFQIKEGEILTVSFDIEAREYQGKWYNSIRAWKVDRNAEQAAAQPAYGAPAPAMSAPTMAAPVAPEAIAESTGGDDLPF